MLTHLADRPLTMIRMPEGIAGERFYQKHWDPELPPFARKITIFSEHKDERHDYLVCDNLATLLWLAQSGTQRREVVAQIGRAPAELQSRQYLASPLLLEKK